MPAFRCYISAVERKAHFAIESVSEIVIQGIGDQVNLSTATLDRLLQKGSN